MGFIRNLFSSGGAGPDGEPASPRNQNPWRSVFNPGSPQWRSAKGSAHEVDKPDPAHQGSVMDEIVRAPSVGQAKVAGVPPAAEGAGAAPPSPSAAAASSAGARAQADRSAAPHEFGGMDKHGFGA
jgi:hypothetical protein